MPVIASRVGTTQKCRYVVASRALALPGACPELGIVFLAASTRAMKPAGRTPRRERRSWQETLRTIHTCAVDEERLMPHDDIISLWYYSVKTTPTAKILIHEEHEEPRSFLFDFRELRALRGFFRLRPEAALWFY